MMTLYVCGIVIEVYDSLDKDYAWIVGFPFLLKAVGA